MKNIFKYAVINALSTVAYIAVVGSLMFYASHFAKNPEPSVFIPIFMLTLLVVSVATVGSLVFGRPVLWYLDGKKTEAIKLLATTLAIMFAVVIIVFLKLFII